MITPRFSCTQTNTSVAISIYCPSVRASDAEIHVDDTLVSIHINPYFLRLNFPDSLLEDDASTASYDPSTGYLTLTLTKEHPGREFPDLDLLAKLLAPRHTVAESAPKPAPTIEVISSTPAENEDGEEEEGLVDRIQGLSLDQKAIYEAAENDWQLDQQIPEKEEDPPLLELSSQKHYGFLNLHSGYFRHVGHSENEVNELGVDAETCPVDERRVRRLKCEEEKWDEDYYAADYADDEYIQELIAWKNPQVDNDRGGSFEFTEEEKATMLRLPRKEYLASAVEEGQIYHTLVSVLFAYAYEARTSQDDPTTESAWTVCSLIPAFAALDPPPYRSPLEQKKEAEFLISESTTTSSSPSKNLPESELAATLTASYRRSLAYPLHRSFALAESCRKDVGRLLARGGKRTVTRCLLKTKEILDHHEVYYVYSKVWIDDLCVWIQTHANDETLEKMGKTIEGLVMKKEWIGWDLETLEGIVDNDDDADDSASTTSTSTNTTDDDDDDDSN